MMVSISSMTSKYASLFVYLTPVRLQGTFDNWPVGNVALTLMGKKWTRVFKKPFCLSDEIMRLEGSSYHSQLEIETRKIENYTVVWVKFH